LVIDHQPHLSSSASSLGVQAATTTFNFSTIIFIIFNHDMVKPSSNHSSWGELQLRD
jgi:phosphohistidine phosphatase SixA